MEAVRRPSMWHLWVPLLVILVVVAFLWIRTGSGTVLDPAGTTTRSSVPAGSPTSERTTPESGLPTIAESALPRQAKDTLALIRAGGPYPYPQDDDVFGNREGILPDRGRGYYREYTVRTPGEDDRGPRRIVAGADGDLYWTTDHYASFRQILEGR